MDRLSGIVLSGMRCFQEDFSLAASKFFRKLENSFCFQHQKDGGNPSNLS
jgi:hypothetical protein